MLERRGLWGKGRAETGVGYIGLMATWSEILLLLALTVLTPSPNLTVRYHIAAACATP